MFKRVLWATVGYGAGLGTSWWAYRKTRAAAERYLPGELAARVGDYATDFGRDVRDAVSAGRMAMSSRQQELRDSLGISDDHHDSLGISDRPHEASFGSVPNRNGARRALR